MAQKVLRKLTQADADSVSRQFGVPWCVVRINNGEPVGSDHYKREVCLRSLAYTKSDEAAALDCKVVFRGRV